MFYVFSFFFLFDEYKKILMIHGLFLTFFVHKIFLWNMRVNLLLKLKNKTYKMHH